MLQAPIALLVVSVSTGWLPTGLRWNSTRPIPYCITANATQTNVSPADQRAALEAAINSWVSQGSGGSLSCSTYRAAPATYTCGTRIDSSDGRFNIFWNRSNWRQGSGTIGVTYSSGTGEFCGTVTDDTGQSWNLGCKYDSDIEFNDVNFTWTTNGRNGTDIQSIMAHEYGHFIGLDHCNDNNTCSAGSAIMFAAYIGGALRVPFQDDIQGGCALYPGTPGGLGWSCSSNQECTSNICITPGSSGYCSTTCGSCPQGYACKPNPTNSAQNVCLRDDGRNRALCETCLGLPDACADNGVCVGGLPEQDVGRCLTPCPNPAATNGGCPTDYRCRSLANEPGQYCMPGSFNCDDSGAFTELTLGQQCDGESLQCVAGLDCYGICTRECTGAPGQGNCEAGFVCATFEFQQIGARSLCVPPVNEGQTCDGLTGCSVGPCLTDGRVGSPAVCYRDCAADPSVCNNAQRCTTYMLQGGGQVSVCEPPGVPPRIDAGVADIGPVDVGALDSGVGDSGAADSGLSDGGADAGVPDFGIQDSGASTADTGGADGADGSNGGTDGSEDANSIGDGSTGNDAGADAGFTVDETCGCNTSDACDRSPNGDICYCDPQCRALCPCDYSAGCNVAEDGVSACACDPGCESTSCGSCTSVHGRDPSEEGGGTLGLLSLIALAFVLRRPIRR